MDDLFVGGAGDGMATVGVPYPGFVRATYAHMGGLVAIGAPYAREWIGASVEAGLSLTMLDEERPLPRAYGKGTVVLQLPRERGIRPYLALSYIGSNDGMNQTVAADLGLAWGSW
jgi:hypothetical protein